MPIQPDPLWSLRVSINISRQPVSHADDHLCFFDKGLTRLTYEQILVGMIRSSHALGVPVVLHSCLYKVLVDGRQHCHSRIEICIEEHLLRLDLQGTKFTVSQRKTRPPEYTYFSTLR